MRLFLRQSTVGREPLPVAMSGVRMGERLLQIGVDDPAVAATLASKPGLTGESTILVADETAAVRVRRAIADTGALVNVRVHPFERVPVNDGSLDAVVVNDRGGLLTSEGDAGRGRIFAECLRALRPGGRLVVFEQGSPSGFSAMFHSRKTDTGTGERTVRALEGAGFRAVRLLGDRDNYRFIEGLKAAG